MIKKKDLLKEIERLEDRVALLEFYREANSELYVINHDTSPLMFYSHRRVKWVYNGKLHETYITYSLNCDYRINGSYIEIYNTFTQEIEDVYTHDRDKLVAVNLDLYLKAYHQVKKTSNKKAKTEESNDS